MSEKNKINDETKDEIVQVTPKKKKRCCLNCFIVVMIIVVVFSGGLVGGAFWAWGKYAEPSMEMSLTEFFGILNKTMNGKEKDIVTNAFEEKDLDAFYEQMKEKMFLKDESNVTIMDIINGYVPKANNTTQPTGYTGTDGYDLRPIYSQEENNAKVEASSQVTTGNSDFDKLLQQFDFDFSSLANYDGAPHVLQITDKELAAVVNQALKSAEQINGFKEQVAQIKNSTGIDIVSLVSLRQIIIDNDNIADQTNIRLSVTLQLKAREMMAQVLEKNGMPKFLSSFVPKNFFVTTDLYPNNGDKSAGIKINSASAEEINKLIAGIEKLVAKTSGEQSGSGISEIFNTINNQVVETITKMQEFCPIVFISSEKGGAIQSRPIEAILKMMKLTISEGQFLSLIRDVKLPTKESLDLDKYTETKRDENVELFIQSLVKNYGIIETEDNKITKDNIFQQINSFSTDPNFANRIDIKKITDFSKEYTEDYAKSIRVKGTYQGYAGLFNNYLTTNTQTTNGVQITVLNIKYFDRKGESVGFDTPTDALLLTLQIDLAKMFGVDGNTSTSTLMTKFLPECIFVDAIVDIAPVTESYASQPTIMSLNKKSQNLTHEHFNTIISVASSLNVTMPISDSAAMGLMLGNMVRENLTKTEKAMGQAIIFEEEYIHMANFFEFMATQEMVKPSPEDTEGKVFIDKDLYEMFNKMHIFDNKHNNVGENCNAEKFVGELENKYYFKKQGEVEITQENPNGKPLLDPNDGKSIVNGLKNVGNTMGDTISLSRMYGDQTVDENNNLKPIMTQEEMGFIFGANSALDTLVSYMKEVKVIGSTILNGEILLTIAGNTEIKETIPDDPATPDVDESQTNTKYEKLMPQKIFIKVIINIQGLKDALNKQVPPSAEPDVPVEPTYEDFVTFTINDFDNEIKDDKGKTQLDDFFTFFTRLAKTTTTNIAKDIQDKTLAFMRDLSKSGIELLFVDGDDNGDGGQLIINDTIFQVAVNELYKNLEQGEIKPTSKEFRNIIKKINSQSASDLEDKKALNVAQNTAEVAKELNAKYFLTAGNRFDETGAKDVEINNINNLANSYSSMIDGKGMTESGVSIQFLQPRINEKQLAKLISKQAINLEQGLSDLTLIFADIKDEKTLVLGYSAKMSAGGENSYKAFVPEVVLVELFIDLSKISSAEECATIKINQMTDEDMQSDDSPYKGNEIALFVNLIKKFNGQIINMSTLKDNASRDVKNNLSTMSSDMGMKLYKASGEENEDSVGFYSVYEMVANSVNKKNNNTNTTADSLKATLEALHKQLPEYGTDNFVDNATFEFSVNNDNATFTAIVNEAFVGKTIKNNLDKFTAPDGAFSSIAPDKLNLLRVGLINYNSSNSSDIDKEIMTLGERVTADGKYLVTTFQLNSQAVMGNENTLLPENFNLTYYMNGDNSYNWVVVGALTQEQKEIFEELAKANGNKLESILGESVGKNITTNISNIKLNEYLTIAQLLNIGTIADGKLTAENKPIK